MVKQRLLRGLRRDFFFFSLKKPHTKPARSCYMKVKYLTEVKVMVVAMELTDLCCRYICYNVSNTLSNATVACD